MALPSITGVLCFIDGDWPVFRPPTSFRGVRLESERTIQKLVAKDRALDTPAVALAVPMAFETLLGSGARDYAPAQMTARASPGQRVL